MKTYWDYEDDLGTDIYRADTETDVVEIWVEEEKKWADSFYMGIQTLKWISEGSFVTHFAQVNEEYVKSLGISTEG